MHGGAAALRNWKHGQFAAASQEECAAIQAAIRHTVDLIRQASQAPVRDSPDANL
jgi:hypothetical protein